MSDGTVAIPTFTTSGVVINGPSGVLSSTTSLNIQDIQLVSAQTIVNGSTSRTVHVVSLLMGPVIPK